MFAPESHLDRGERALPGLDGRGGGPADVDGVGEDGEEVGVLGAPPGGEPRVPGVPALLARVRIYQVPRGHQHEGL